ncbi:hypothetical protein QBC47DRAFT_342056 [Echria macrotheca]|uniref:SET domain-containing protein n=1 Tax=Echria macrotheca TaxID=438768 RepID=A0AAJ0BEY3_9PEZI|nr:hypothetical protein QBC47DRAFT_342056 [Echria macrotheca]
MNPLLVSLILPLSVPALASSQPQCTWGLPRHPFPVQHLHHPFCPSPYPTTTKPIPPWTHNPYCINTSSSSSPPWCVFTNAALPSHSHNPHGLSIITTPDLASTLFSNLTSARLDAAYTQPPPPDRLFLEKPYAVIPIAGKGMGAVATRRIQREKVVMVDLAAVLATVDYPADVAERDVRELLRVAVERLGDVEGVMGLARRGLGDLELTVEEDVIGTNSFQLSVAERGYLGLFPEVSRINHACKPNAHIHFSETTLAMTVWSARDIEAGEEITISYAGVDLPSVPRREMLSSTWGFDCSCSLCTAPETERKASDDRRLAFHKLRSQALNLAQEGKYKDAAKRLKELLRVVDEEGLEPFIGDLYELPARVHYQAGDLETARKYFEKCMVHLQKWAVPGPEEEQSLENVREILARLEVEMRERKTSKTKPQVYLGNKT